MINPKIILATVGLTERQRSVLTIITENSAILLNDLLPLTQLSSALLDRTLQSLMHLGFIVKTEEGEYYNRAQKQRFDAIGTVINSYPPGEERDALLALLLKKAL